MTIIDANTTKTAEGSLARLKKFEDTLHDKVTVQNDPMAQKAPTEVELTVQDVTQSLGTSSFAENIQVLAKRAKLTKGRIEALLKSADGAPAEVVASAREAVAKMGAAGDKLDAIQTMLNLSDEEVAKKYPNTNFEYALRWAISDAISILANAAEVEKIVGTPVAKSDEPAPVEKAATPAVADDEWPSDMAVAKLDEKTGVYKSETPRWGKDALVAAKV